MDETTFAVRIGVAALLSAVLGFERELKGTAAGLRTHILVAVGACLFTVSGLYAALYAIELGEPTMRMDITRLPSQVVVGVGFLGGGTILRHGASVRGLTTAANLWVAAAVGLSTGLGMYRCALITTGLVLFVLAGLKPLERWLASHRQRDTGDSGS